MGLRNRKTLHLIFFCQSTHILESSLTSMKVTIVNLKRVTMYRAELFACLAGPPLGYPQVARLED